MLAKQPSPCRRLKGNRALAGRASNEPVSGPPYRVGQHRGSGELRPMENELRNFVIAFRRGLLGHRACTQSSFMLGE